MGFYINGEKPVIAVTGSAGKTTTKTMIAAILREKLIVFESKDYYNTTEKTLEHKDQISFIHHAIVLEYGMAYLGFIAKHCEIIKPNIGVITNVGLSHIGNFDTSINGVAKAKSELIHGTDSNGLILVNRDDENSKLLDIHQYKGRVISVGINTVGEYRGENIEFCSDGMNFTVKLDKEEHVFNIPCLGEHNIYNALFAIAVTHKLGFDPEDIKFGLKNLKMPNHRLNLRNFKNGISVIDDTVHAYPAAMKSALDVATKIKKSKIIAILGSMAELGDIETESHMDVGRYVASKNIDFLYTFGNISRNIGMGAIEAGMPEYKVKHFTPLYRKVMHRELIEKIYKDTIVLVKGASRLELFQTVEFLWEKLKQ